MSKTGFAMFLAGATVGAAATWLCLRRYYEQITQEEIDSVKAAFAERKPVIANIAKNEKSNEKQEENQHKADIAKLKPDLVNYAAKLQEEGYTNYTEHSKKNTEEKKDEPKLTGTMKNNGAVTKKITTRDEEVTIPQGFHDGSGKVGIDATEKGKLIANNIREGVTILGVEGTMSGSENMKPQAKTVTPSTAKQTILPDTEYNCLSQVEVEAIPYVEADNPAGGVTVTIAG